MIKIKNIKFDKPTEPYDVKICRLKSVLGNPFVLHNEDERDYVCDEYEKYFYEQIENKNIEFIDELNRLIDIYNKYKKLNLFCFCYPKRCHAETIKEYILKQVRRINKPVVIIDLYNLWIKYSYVGDCNTIKNVTYFLELFHRNIDDYYKVIFVLDTPKENHVNIKLFKEYKQHRESKKDLFKTFNDFLKLLSIYPCEIVKNSYYEADQTIAAIALSYEDRNVIVYSNDKDFCQLTHKSNIKIAETFKDGRLQVVTKDQIYKKFKIGKDGDYRLISEDLETLPLYRCFKGDVSDGLPAPIPKLNYKYIKKIIDVCKEKRLTDKILGSIIIRLGDQKEFELRDKIVENFDSILVNFQLMNLCDCGKNLHIKNNTKRIKAKVNKDNILQVVQKYKLDAFKNFLVYNKLLV